MMGFIGRLFGTDKAVNDLVDKEEFDLFMLKVVNETGVEMSV